MNPTKLYVSDLDGTLLDEAGSLSNFSRQSLSRLLNDGMHFTVATSRSLGAVKAILHPLVLRLPIIQLNGCLITDFKSGKHLRANLLPPELQKQVLQEFRRLDLHPFIAAWENDEDKLFFTHFTNQAMHWYFLEKHARNDPRLTRLNKYEDVSGDQVLSLTVLDSHQVLSELASGLKRSWGESLSISLFQHPYETAFWELSVQASKANKGDALDQLIDVLGWQATEVVAFGDSENDIPLLRRSTRAVVVANGHPVVIGLADELIGANKDDGVMTFLLDDFYSREARQP